MAVDNSEFSASEVLNHSSVQSSPSRAIVPAGAYQMPAPFFGDGGMRGPEILHGGINQSSLANCLRRRWLMALGLGLLAGAAAAVLLLWLFPQTSRITAYLKVKSQSSGKVFETQIERLSPHEVERQAMNHLALLMSPLVLDAALQDQRIAGLDAVRSHAGQELLWLQEDLRVSFPGDGEILEVNYEGEEDPDQMKAVVDGVVKAYQDKVLLQERVMAASTQADLKIVLTDAKKRLEAQLNALQTKAEGAGNLREDVEIPQLSNEIRNLENLIIKTQDELVNIEVFKELAVQNGNSNASIEAMVALELDKDPTIATYQQNLVTMEMDRQSKLSTSRNPNSADIKRATQTIDQLKMQLEQYRRDAEAAIRDRLQKLPNDQLRASLAEYRIRHQAATDNLAKYQKQLDDAELKLLDLGVRDPEQEMLENNIESETEIAKNLQLRVSEWEVINEARARQERAGGASDFDKVTVLQPATAVPAINRIERFSIAGIGGLAAMALTCYGVALLEFRHRRLNGPNDVDEGLGIRVLGVLPSTSLKALTGSSLVATQVAEAIDNVRATLMHDAGAAGRQVIMVTSSATMEGTTVVASSLALSLARAGRRTLLVDGDLRSPSLHKLFGMPIEDGFSEVLRSEIDLVDAVKPTNNEGLYLLTAGVCNAEAIHALATDQPQAIFEKLRDQFDFIVIDAPPVLGISDSLSLGQYIDGAILTVLRDHSEIRKVYKAVEILRGMGVRVLGSVVNGVPLKADRRVVRLHQTGASQAPRLTKVDA
jgi:capsular exopolysaccharide synthesis family protein